MTDKVKPWEKEDQKTDEKRQLAHQRIDEVFDSREQEDAWFVGHILELTLSRVCPPFNQGDLRGFSGRVRLPREGQAGPGAVLVEPRAVPASFRAVL